MLRQQAYGLHGGESLPPPAIALPRHFSRRCSEALLTYVDESSAGTRARFKEAYRFRTPRPWLGESGSFLGKPVNGLQFAIASALNMHGVSIVMQHPDRQPVAADIPWKIDLLVAAQAIDENNPCFARFGRALLQAELDPSQLDQAAMNAQFTEAFEAYYLRRDADTMTDPW